MSLTDYLAKNYLTADAPHKSSKKRKRKEATAGLVIADDDPNAWTAAQDGRNDDDRPLTVSGRTAEFRKAKKNNWTAVGAPAPTNDEQAAADEILTKAAAEQDARAGDAQDDGPQLVDIDGGDGPRMESGALAGLQSAAQVSAAIEARQLAERRRFEADPSAAGKGAETIYRDASGRIINVAMKRAEARKAADEEERKKKAEADALVGDVQRAEKEKRRKDLQDAKYMSIARYADDAEMNEEMKEQDRWNDPAAQFITKKKEGRSVTGKPLYQSASAPNRYGIRPGHRWDGVDRSNEFEKEYFRKRNEAKNIKDLKYQWQMDE